MSRPKHRAAFKFMDTRSVAKKIIVPIHISPCKPFNPSHMLHLLVSDMIFKVARFLHSDTHVEYHYNRTDIDTSWQVIKLHLFLQNKFKNSFYFQEKCDHWLGEQYIECHRENFNPTENEVMLHKQHAEESLEGFPYYQSILPNWKKQHDILAIHDPGFFTPKQYQLTEEELYLLLNKKGLLLDARRAGGGVYLDVSQEGLFLKRLSANNQYTYNQYASLLRSLLPKINSGDQIVFIYDDEVDNDFTILQKVVEAFGARVETVVTSRIEMGGKKVSSRNGGWEAYTLQKALDRYTQEYSHNECRLGFRLYYLNHFTRVLRSFKNNLFAWESFDEYMKKAKTLLSETQSADRTPNKELKELIQKERMFSGKVPHPYQITEYVLSKKINPSLRNGIISEFYLDA